MSKVRVYFRVYLLGPRVQGYILQHYMTWLTVTDGTTTNEKSKNSKKACCDLCVSFLSAQGLLRPFPRSRNGMSHFLKFKWSQRSVAFLDSGVRETASRAPCHRTWALAPSGM